MSTEPITSAEGVEKVDYIRVAQIAFVEKGKHKPFVFAVYQNGTMVVWIDKTMDSVSYPTSYEIIQKANSHLEKFPGFTPGTPDADFRVIYNEEMFGDLPEKVYFVSYDHGQPYLSCVIGDMSDMEAGLLARENFEKDAHDKVCIRTGFNPQLPP